MKSKRAIIERRNAERRSRREQEKNPPSLFSKLFDRIWKFVQVLFILSLFVAALYPAFMDPIPGPGGTDLIPYAAERMATFLLFGILATACVVGTRILFKRTADSPRKARKKSDSRWMPIMKFALLLFFVLVFAFAAIICWAQLKALAEVWQFLL
ncbi:hypothetical protein [Paenibacillus mendelii]|uniref:Uncharacterized protein n=1 Tax=Paenibacillus mendelii TaxID=206163 RepID=A0ABV6JB36_9BACL|nr:hypothetical protein [Paenibacillus mendelii]MCQ6561250.1 hypothetical protein [Paenibacillus mendelii]